MASTPTPAVERWGTMAAFVEVGSEAVVLDVLSAVLSPVLEAASVEVSVERTLEVVMVGVPVAVAFPPAVLLQKAFAPTLNFWRQL